MGVAAHNRGSRSISLQLEDDRRPIEFKYIEMLNGLEKYPDAGTPFGPIHFVEAGGAWWAECPKTGFGFHYKTLREAVRRWNVIVVGYNNGKYIADPG